MRIPHSWEHVDPDTCDLGFERWAPPGSTCDSSTGVAFFVEAVFDPAFGPGVHRSRGADAPAWTGWTAAGRYAVHAADDRRAVVARILASVATP